MAKTLGTYKGLWKQESAPAVGPSNSQGPSEASEPRKGAQASKPPHAASQSTQTSGPAQASAPQPSQSTQTSGHAQASASQQAPSQFTQSPGPSALPAQETADQLAHRYRMLVLREHRYKLGRDLLEAGHQDPWALGFGAVTSLGQSFRPWAHARIFALGCYLGVEMSPEILKQLRHPVWIGRYRRSMHGLWRLLEILAQKTGQKPVSRFFFRLFYLCPPLGILIYERQLQSVLRKAQGSNAVMAPVLAKAPQGQ